MITSHSPFLLFWEVGFVAVDVLYEDDEVVVPSFLFVHDSRAPAVLLLLLDDAFVFVLVLPTMQSCCTVSEWYGCLRVLWTK